MTGPAGLDLPPGTLSPARGKELTEALAAARAGVAWRREPAARKAAFARRAGVEVPAGELDSALERVIASPDFLPGSWLAQALAAADAVALVDLPGRGTATGFLVTPWLLLTNQHVFPTAEIAAEGVLRFRYQSDREGRINRVRQHATDPARFFLADPALDYALVAVAPRADGRAPGEIFGFLPLISSVGKVLLGQPVNLVQHPRGRPRELVVRNSLVLALDDRLLHYTGDTDPGSSGSPLFNDRWEVVGLHHRAVEAHDDAGRPVDLDGRPVTADTPPDRRRWVANEGIRASVITTDILTRELSPAQRALTDGIGGTT